MKIVRVDFNMTDGQLVAGVPEEPVKVGDVVSAADYEGEQSLAVVSRVGEGIVWVEIVPAETVQTSQYGGPRLHASGLTCKQHGAAVQKPRASVVIHSNDRTWRIAPLSTTTRQQSSA